MQQTLADELSRTGEVELSLEAGIPVLTPRARSDFRFLAGFATQQRTRLLELVRWSGAVMVRGFEVATGDQYTQLMSGCLGTTPVTNKVLTTLFAWAKRKRRGEGVYDLPPADLQMQGPHIEVGWRSRRPRYISLWCEVPPIKAGETALFDMAAAYDHLDDELRAYFDRYASEYPAFGEKFVEDSVLVHPETGRRCLVLWYYQSPLADHAVAAYRETEHYRRNPIQDAVPFMAINSQLSHAFCDGRKRIKLSRELSVRLMRQVYRATHYVTWQAGDIVIVDNIAMGHGRMPCVPPRKIVVGYWNEVDMRAYTANRNVATDDCPPLSRAGASPGYVARLLVSAVTGRLRF